ncbi:O-antigen polymerase [Thermincola potens JR]|uniref:O-antigen polymerase n=1 Tax=Thermincola potens (strain JR) TaxID=635013 RepID=D5XAH7_THEPJ|nr:O-antigen polymerase [Thermincola potens JR]
MKKISLLIISIFVLFFLTFNPFLSICFAGSGTSDNSISGEVKLYEAVEVRHETTYGEDIGFWSPTGGKVGIWDYWSLLL